MAALNEDDGKSAEKILRKAIKLAPDKPDLQNNLATALLIQGRFDEADKLHAEIQQRWPDYVFGRIALASRLIQEKKIEKALKVIEPLRKRKKIHITEHDALCQIMVMISFAQNDLEQAKYWLDQLQRFSPAHPQIAVIERQLKILSQPSPRSIIRSWLAPFRTR